MSSEDQDVALGGDLDANPATVLTSVENQWAEELLAGMADLVSRGHSLPQLQTAFFGPTGQIASRFGRAFEDTPLYLGAFLSRVRQLLLRAEFNSPLESKTLQMLVRHYASLGVLMLQPDFDVEQAGRELQEQGVTGAPVVDAQGQLVGMLTERDLLSIYRLEGKAVPTVREAMTTLRLLSVEADDLLTEAAKLLCSHSYRGLPVLRQQRVVGVLTRRDVLKFIESVSVSPNGQLSAPELATGELAIRDSAPADVASLCV